MLIDSAKRQSTDMYEVQYEHVPHFCFSCGRIGHSDMVCPTPGTRDANGVLPFGKGLRAPDERKRASSGESSAREQPVSQNSKVNTRHSSSDVERGTEVTSPIKKSNQNKRKGGEQPLKKVYRRVETPLLMNTPFQGNEEHAGHTVDRDDNALEGERDPKKMKPTPTNSNNLAEAVEQPCLSK